MYYATDLKTADRVLADLRSARLSGAATALPILHRIRNEVACDRVGEQKRIAAWMAIRNLYDACRAAPEHDLKALWQDAIGKTEAWRESMR